MNEVVKASVGHIENNQTFVTKPPAITKNATTVEDLKKKEESDKE